MNRGFAVVLLVTALSAPAAELVWQQPEDPTEPYSIEQIRHWHEAWGTHWPWGEPEYSLHLRDDKREQLLLMISGYARGGEFLLFLPQDGKWQASKQRIQLAHHPLQVLPAQRDGWHEFETYVPAWGSGGAEVWVTRYRWNGHDYEEAEQRDAQWCELPYFRETASDLCTAQ